ncbi:hypothetical protein [Zestomonas carbonaria]|uniref:hypothetical protein n=1 Tax=Zestomonas carbonaria TaxID=2762745 RepID=UPI001656EB33|nr:hypothetical protein [Pseudomonas carbonaria]
MSDWHLIHLGHLALSGAGLLTIETTLQESGYLTTLAREMKNAVDIPVAMISPFAGYEQAERFDCRFSTDNCKQLSLDIFSRHISPVSPP